MEKFSLFIMIVMLNAVVFMAAVLISNTFISGAVAAILLPHIQLLVLKTLKD